MDNRVSRTNSVGVFLIFCVLILGAYANSFHAAWHFDDKPNILNNYHLHIQDLKPQTLASTLFSNPKNPYQHAKKMYRPIPCLTFALNWFIGGDDPFGFHVVNIGLHILTGFLLFLFIRALYTTPTMHQASSEEKWLVSILASVLWAVNPIHTQAVTYVVQRMAVMAGFFYLLGLFAFLKARLMQNSRSRMTGFGICFICYILALGSKENAIMLPISLILIEFGFFQDFRQRKVRAALIGVIALTGLLLGIIGIIFFLKNDASVIFGGYETRPFSMTERLLTEMRILTYYVSQIFYSVPTRLSIDHDIVISTSLMHPWTTLPAAIFLLTSFIAGVVVLGKHPLIGFSLLFFFINHVIESSIIPLELIFEHRNYLPSFFMFVPVILGLKRIFERYGRSSNTMRYSIYVFVVLLIFGYGTGTFIRNRAWATEKSLWEDAAIKAPNSARPLTNLAWDMAYGANAHPNNYDDALTLYSKSLKLNQVRNGMNSSVLNNMAGLYYQKKDYDTAIELLQESLRQKPSNRKSRFDLSSIYIALGEWENAQTSMELLVKHPKVHEGYLNQQALILLHQNKAREAVPMLNKSLQMAPAYWKTLTYLGVAFKELGEHEKADNYLKHGLLASKNSPLTLFCLIDNAMASGNKTDAQDYTARLLATFSVGMIQSFLKELRHDNQIPPISYTAISLSIKEHILEMGGHLPDFDYE